MKQYIRYRLSKALEDPNVTLPDVLLDIYQELMNHEYTAELIQLDIKNIITEYQTHLDVLKEYMKMSSCK